jgi:hypothetical protein
LSRTSLTGGRTDPHGYRLGEARRFFYAQTQGSYWAARSARLCRFATAAEAIRFKVEEFPVAKTLGAWMQVGDDRFDSDEIGRLYESRDYPLERVVSRKDG